jgi:mRNA-degrading endonuclease toxin of MazEF toxin-antitoxin module
MPLPVIQAQTLNEVPNVIICAACSVSIQRDLGGEVTFEVGFLP